MSYTQRQTPIYSQLCTLLIEDMYGELPARVFTVLDRFGRQRRQDISRASYLEPSQVAHGLIILIQQHLIFHSPATEPTTWYEIDWQQSYALIRVGKIVAFIEERFDKKFAYVASNLLTLGHVSLADLREALFPPSEEEEEVVNGKKANGTKPNGDATSNGQTSLANGTEHGDPDDETLASPEELYGIIQTLMEHGWVIQAAEAQYLSAEEMHNIARQQALNEQWGGSVPTGTKDKDRLAQLIMANKRRIRDTWLEKPTSFPMKRKADDSSYGSRKRTKINGDGSAGGSDQTPEDDLVIRINPEKAAVAMRNRHLVSLVEQRIGDTTARLYEILLRSLEKNIPRCFEEHPDPPPTNVEDQPQWEPNPDHVVNTKDITQRAKMLGVDICEGLDPHYVARVTKTTANKEGVLAQPADHSSLGFHERQELVEAHLELLVIHPLHFVTWHARGQYRVDFDLLSKSLIQQEIETTVLAKKGNKARMVIRALVRKGRVDERQLCNAMMTSPNDVRTLVSDLTLQGFVQTQEVPKVDRREAKLSLHLIWYDTQRARDQLLHNTYKGQVRHLQRIAFEREKVQDLLTKANRTDVAGNETKYLKQTELDDLKKWKEVQEKLLLQLHRMDDLVAVLRDFYGPLLTA
ncbi:DNA directed RNA polymeras-like protein III subunit Rpc82 [Karstenula rhodostoma CBS 690.94]|uniref:DNA-directed RNA polymerase III subunit RPC3 n=1 Tax=Karstenula rhodostoma CBS 690.94 TaxID=1392251 RepID=A0A9P4PEG3_9PLEO|nr:DNA directed RNA polymeras-like protein III subunit Rpc82 [Karstenula rhodostoma CBS 690.94]